MYTEHEVARKRQLLGGSNEVDVETDEQLARRLHEELNALTRHSRRAAAAPSGPSTQQKTGKPVSAQNDKQTAKQHRGSDAAKQPSLAAVKQEAVGVREQQTGSDREEKGRKRCMLNRELAMLVVDMVESQVKPVNGPRSKLKGEQQQENHNAAVKHESSSSLSEQERLAIEHLHAAGADGKLVNKLLLGSHLLARVRTQCRICVGKPDVALNHFISSCSAPAAYSRRTCVGRPEVALHHFISSRSVPVEDLRRFPCNLLLLPYACTGTSFVGSVALCCALVWIAVVNPLSCCL